MIGSELLCMFYGKKFRRYLNDLQIVWKFDKEPRKLSDKVITTRVKSGRRNEEKQTTALLVAAAR